MDPYILFISLFGPFIVWFIELVLPYPHLIEELFKTFVIFFFPKKTISSYVYAGIAFTLSETVLYSININYSGEISLIFVRLITTGILHIATYIIIYLFAKKDKKMIIFGFLIASVIHYLFNLVAATF